MYAVSEFTELSDRLACLRETGSEQFTGALRVALELLVGELQVDEGCHQTLLGAIVEVARETRARGIRGGDDSRAGGDQIGSGVHDAGDVTPDRGGDHEGGEGDPIRAVAERQAAFRRELEVVERENAPERSDDAERESPGRRDEEHGDHIDDAE